jgi:hypothetical protein
LGRLISDSLSSSSEKFLDRLCSRFFEQSSILFENCSIGGRNASTNLPIFRHYQVIGSTLLPQVLRVGQPNTEQIQDLVQVFDLYIEEEFVSSKRLQVVVDDGISSERLLSNK